MSCTTPGCEVCKCAVHREEPARDCRLCAVERAADRLSKLGGSTNITLPKPPDRGWQCPVCDAVWAPFVRKCEGCK